MEITFHPGVEPTRELEVEEEEQFKAFTGESLPGNLRPPEMGSKTPPLFQRAFRRVLEAFLAARTGNFTQAELGSSALVLSPHKDDETLACGALLTGKIRAGARVKVAFYTDGRNSCPGAIPPGELSGLRTREAREACRVLGLQPEDLVFLELEDGHLAEHEEEARREIAKLLEEFRPSEVYLPYRHETTEDHRAAHRISLSALAGAGFSVRVYEYPVWFWFHWPWVRTPWVGLREKPNRIRTGLVSGWRLLRDFNRKFPARTFLELKRKALDCYKSQMTKIVDVPACTTLEDVAGGEFLACFFRKMEIFRAYELPGRGKG